MGLLWRMLQVGHRACLFESHLPKRVFKQPPLSPNRESCTSINIYVSTKMASLQNAKEVDYLQQARSECGQPCTILSEACATGRGCCPASTSKLGFK